MKNKIMQVILSISVALANSAYAERGYEDPTLDWLPAELNWDKAQTVMIMLDDNVFNPDDVVLKANQPYKLILDNISNNVTHNLVDIDFFHAVVLKKMVVNGITINTPHIHSVQLRPNSQLSMFVVPVREGEYEVFCSVPGHREDGMEGYITIEPETAGIP